MHYVFALAAAFLATAVAASPHVKYEYRTVTVYHTRHGSYGWRNKSPKPNDKQDPADRDPIIQSYNDFPKPAIQRYDSFPKPAGQSYSWSFQEKKPSKEKTDDGSSDDNSSDDNSSDDNSSDDNSSDHNSSDSSSRSGSSGSPSGSGSSGSSSGSGSSGFSDECLKVHNEKRAIHGVPPLTWDPTMAEHALGVSQTCVFKHSGSSYGENIAAGYASATKALDAWYDENTQYSYEKGEYGEATGHFTQMVWKSAKKVGCATFTCNNKNGTPGEFVTCNYDTGNVIGEFLANVFPPKSG